jgi:hypothetical protein
MQKAKECEPLRPCWSPYTSTLASVDCIHGASMSATQQQPISTGMHHKYITPHDRSWLWCHCDCRLVALERERLSAALTRLHHACHSSVHTKCKMVDACGYKLTGTRIVPATTTPKKAACKATATVQTRRRHAGQGPADTLTALSKLRITTLWMRVHCNVGGLMFANRHHQQQHPD